MLPNHAPLVIAEQFGTLATLHPGRIDLGLGRAPGTDQVTLRALRRDPMDAETFPQDVLELQALPRRRDAASPASRRRRARARDVPLYILGSSLFGAQLAARARAAVRVRVALRAGCAREAVEVYRRDFRPSEQLAGAVRHRRRERARRRTIARRPRAARARVWRARVSAARPRPSAGPTRRRTRCSSRRQGQGFARWGGTRRSAAALR